MPPGATEDEVEVVPEATGDEVDGDFPSAVDITKSPYFPKLSGSITYYDQKAIDSAVFATVYYQFTYEMNKLRGVETTYENTFSPLFVYDVINKGIKDGSGLEDTYNYLKNIGCATNATYPYNERQFYTYDNWPGSEAAWREAIRYRMEDSFDLGEVGDADSQIVSPDDSDLAEIKKTINEGKLITANTYIYGWEGNILDDEPMATQVEEYLDCHTVLIVGYDDSIWNDLNRNGVADNGEMGAFKVLTTRTDECFNRRIGWIAYDALNEVSAVEGAHNLKDRIRGLTSMKTITVKESDLSKDIYVSFTLNYGVRSQFSVTFRAEKDGVVYEKDFLPGVNYLVESDRHRFREKTFVYSLSDLVPGLNNDNFDEYDFEMTVADIKEDGFWLEFSAELVNEFTGTRSPLIENLEERIENSEYTAKIQNNIFVYYIGFDDPFLYFKTDEGDFVEVLMVETRERRGYYYKYFIEDETEAVLYFSDNNGKTDDNGGEYFKAATGFNYYATEGQREPLTVHDFGLANGLPDIDTVIAEEDLNKYNYKKTEYFYDYSGGYGPYYITVDYENLDTGEKWDNNYFWPLEYFEYGDPLRKSFMTEGEYVATILVKDWRGTVASKSITFEVKDRPFEISSITMDKEKYYFSDAVEFTIDTSYMNMKTGTVPGEKRVVPKTTCIIKDSDGNIVWAEYSKECSEYSMDDMTTTTHLTYKPMKAGKYTLTVSATDVRGEYAEKTINFTVIDRIYGDANADGVLNIKDATAIQKYVAGLLTDADINKELSDCDGDTAITVKDATSIQKHLAEIDGAGRAGDVIEYIPETFTVRFDNTLGWEKVYCEFFSPAPGVSKTNPGEIMTPCNANEDGVTVYELQIPVGVTKLSFNNGITAGTLRVDFSGKDTHYSPIDNEIGTLYELAEK